MSEIVKILYGLNTWQVARYRKALPSVLWDLRVKIIEESKQKGSRLDLQRKEHEADYPGDHKREVNHV